MKRISDDHAKLLARIDRDDPVSASAARPLVRRKLIEKQSWREPFQRMAWNEVIANLYYYKIIDADAQAAADVVNARRDAAIRDNQE